MRPFQTPEGTLLSAFNNTTNFYENGYSNIPIFQFFSRSNFPKET